MIKLKMQKNRKKASQVAIQISMLVISIFAFSYLVSMAFESEIVSAEENADGGGNEIWACCIDEESENYCQDLLRPDCEEKCERCEFTKCEYVSECKLGCCINKREGTCMSRTPRALCEDKGGEWQDNEGCEIAECQRGCCVLGSSTSFVTKRRCERLSDFYGLNPDFRSAIKTEIECIALAHMQERGACIKEIAGERTCKMTTQEECISETGNIENFYKDYLCTAEELGTICAPSEKTTCVEGKDEVYLVDSCGNPANIYDASKINDKDYWRRIVEKEESCGAADASANANSAGCGNCDYFLGSKCGIDKDRNAEYGNYICRDLNCIDEDGRKRRHGESWCVYDGSIDLGQDIVGSRHWKRYCYEGNIEVEPCADFRNEICVQNDIELAEGGGGEVGGGNGGDEVFSQAACRVNRAMECVAYNQEEDKKLMKEKCEENSDCFMRKVDVDKGFNFNMCVPRYPRGFDMSSDSGQKSAEATCSMANQQCVIVYEKKFSGRWKCVANCDCEKLEFTEKMNNLCTSLGDCGFKVNIADDVDEAYYVSRAPKLSENLAVGSTVWQGNFASPGNLSEFFPAIAGIMGEAGYDQSKAGEVIGNIMGGVAGAIGVGIVGSYLAYATGSLVIEGEVGFLTPFTDLVASGASGIGAGEAGTAASFATAFGNAAAAAAIVMAITFIGIKAFGLKGDAALATAITGAVVATAFAVGAVIKESLIGLCLINVWLCVGLGILLLGMMGLMKLLGIGKTKKRIAEFKCFPWEPPAGGENCGLCNADKMKPCSKYRCQSLGRHCAFLNEGTGREECSDVSDPNDIAAPIIKPNYAVLSEGYNYKHVSELGFKFLKEDGSCIESFSPIAFGISLNELGRCKIATEDTDYDEMDAYFGDSRVFRQNHTMPLFIPSTEAAISSLYEGMDMNELSEEDLAELEQLREQIKEASGNMRFYIRCEDYQGNKNDVSYVIETCIEKRDIEPPAMLSSVPETGSYIAYDANQTFVTLYVNEPANCRWNKDNDESYESMSGEMQCQTSLFESINGWTCNATLSDIKEGENIYYFRCKDKPWLQNDTEDEKRIVNREGFELILKKSESELKIEEIVPLDGSVIFTAQQPMTVNLRVKTAGGAENGKATCSYSFSDYDKMSNFFNTLSSEHIQEFNMLVKGGYNVYIKCEDAGENKATGSTSFRVEVDDKGPRIVRIYHSKDGNKLTVITNEDSECRYSDDLMKACTFKFDEGERMTGMERKHETTWKTGKVYYIKCRDEWDNEMRDCLMIRMYD